MNSEIELHEWLAVWDRVCAAADPDDGPLPPWEEVRKVIGPEYGENFPSAEYFDAYMTARLVDLVRDFLATPNRTGGVGAEPEEWRELALQFDGHRIEALSMLRYVSEAASQHEAVGRIGEIKAFLAKPPLSGEAVLAQRLAALASPAIPADHVVVPRERVERRVNTLLDMNEVFAPDQRRATALLLTELYAHLASAPASPPVGDDEAIRREAFLQGRENGLAEALEIVRPAPDRVNNGDRGYLAASLERAMEASRASLDTDDDPEVERIAQAIAVHGVGRPWDDIPEVVIDDICRIDLRGYARAALNAICGRP